MHSSYTIYKIYWNKLKPKQKILSIQISKKYHVGEIYFNYDEIAEHIIEIGSLKKYLK